MALPRLPSRRPGAVHRASSHATVTLSGPPRRAHQVPGTIPEALTECGAGHSPRPWSPSTRLVGAVPAGAPRDADAAVLLPNKSGTISPLATPATIMARPSAHRASDVRSLPYSLRPQGHAPDSPVMLLFASDIHLSTHRPAAVAAFVEFLSRPRAAGGAALPPRRRVRPVARRRRRPHAPSRGRGRAGRHRLRRRSDRPDPGQPRLPARRRVRRAHGVPAGRRTARYRRHGQADGAPARGYALHPRRGVPGVPELRARPEEPAGVPGAADGGAGRGKRRGYGPLRTRGPGSSRRTSWTSPATKWCGCSRIAVRPG